MTESLQISETEAESGDCVSKLDYSGDSPSRPNSDIADVSLEQLHVFASIPFRLGFLVETLHVCVVLCIIHMYSVTLCIAKIGFSVHTKNISLRKHTILDFC